VQLLLFVSLPKVMMFSRITYVMLVEKRCTGSPSAAIVTGKLSIEGMNILHLIYVAD
jgi:hypothetical protein